MIVAALSGSSDGRPAQDRANRLEWRTGGNATFSRPRADSVTTTPNMPEQYWKNWRGMAADQPPFRRRKRGRMTPSG